MTDFHELSSVIESESEEMMPGDKLEWNSDFGFALLPCVKLYTHTLYLEMMIQSLVDANLSRNRVSEYQECVSECVCFKFVSKRTSLGLNYDEPDLLDDRCLLLLLLLTLLILTHTHGAPGIINPRDRQNMSD